MTEAEHQLANWRRRLDDPCFVYVLQQGDTGPIKVGRAVDVRERIKGLQTGNPYPLILLHALPGGSDLEAHFHRQLRRNRLLGEWFDGPLVPRFLEYVATLGKAMDDAYEHPARVAPHWTEVDPLREQRYRGIRSRKEKPPVIVRYVEPDPVTDPAVAAEMRTFKL